MLRTHFILAAMALALSGCTPIRRSGELAKTMARATTGFVAEGLLNGIFDSDEPYAEKIDREEQEECWKQYWRTHPNLNPAMTEAFVDE